MRQKQPSICRTCQNYCAVSVETEDGRVVSVTGDSDNPIYRGYTCVKGRSHASFYDHPERLLRTLKRTADGEYTPIPTEVAIDEIAEKLQTIIAQHGPRSLAIFLGTYFWIDNPINMAIGGAFMKAIGSPMVFSPQTIDQPGKPLAKGIHGTWMAPGQAMHEPDVALLIGTNPLVSHQGRVGHPGDLIKDLAKRGAKLIVIDPRRTETAKRASIFLQPRPGYDVAIIAGLIRLIMEERLFDAKFVAENTTGFDELRRVVEPFTPQYVAARADIPANDLVAAARMYGGAGRAYAAAGTGSNFTGRSTLTEYLVLCLQTLCGHWLRAGEVVRNALTVVPKGAQMAKAQALPPFPAYGFGEKLRVRGFTDTLAGLPVSAMADEILLPGEGQVRALFSLGGNPVNVVPDQLKNIEAFRSLDLLVQTDVQMSATGGMADYIVASKLPYEMAGTNLLADFLSLYVNGWGYPQSYGQYTPAIVDPPAGADVVEQWELLYGIAQRMGLQLEIVSGYGDMVASGEPTVLDMATKPSGRELLALVHGESRVPLEVVERYTNGALFPDPPVVVEPKDPGWEGRLDLGNAAMMSDLRAVAEEPTDNGVLEEFPFRLISRRMMHVMNSPTVAMPKNRPTYNPACLNPSDMVGLSISSGDVIKICSPHAAIVAIAQEDPTMRSGTVSLSHGFGGGPEADRDVRRIGSNSGRLIARDGIYDPYSGQPRMTDVPVRITAYADASSSAAGREQERQST